MAYQKAELRTQKEEKIPLCSEGAVFYIQIQ